MSVGSSVRGTAPDSGVEAKTSALVNVKDGSADVPRVLKSVLSGSLRSMPQIDHAGPFA